MGGTKGDRSTTPSPTAAVGQRKPRGLCRRLDVCVGMGAIMCTTKQHKQQEQQHQNDHHHQPITTTDQEQVSSRDSNLSHMSTCVIVSTSNYSRLRYKNGQLCEVFVPICKHVRRSGPSLCHVAFGDVNDVFGCMFVD